MLQDKLVAVMITVACLGLASVLVAHSHSNADTPADTEVVLESIIDGYGDETEVKDDTSLKALEEKKKHYKAAITNAVKLRAQYDLAKKGAVTSKMELDNFQKERNVQNKLELHKQAAYLEMQRSAAEERSSKAQKKKAELSTKAYQQKKEEANHYQQKAAALLGQARADHAAAMKEVAQAAKNAAGRPHLGALRRFGAGSEVSSNVARASTNLRRAAHHNSKLTGAARTTGQLAAEAAQDAVDDANDAARDAKARPDHRLVSDAEDEAKRASRVVARSEKLAADARDVQHEQKGGGPQEQAQPNTAAQDIAQNVISKIFNDDKVMMS